jgi:hypothetical protein
MSKIKELARHLIYGLASSKTTWPGFLWWLHAAMLRRFWVVSIFTYIEPTISHYKKTSGALHSRHTSFGAKHTSPLLYSFSLSSICFLARQSYLESLSPWKKELLGMNTMKSSSIFKFSYHSYSSAYELEYSCFHVIILIYELVYSLYVMIVTCSTLCLIIHITCMSRIRAKLRWRFIVPSGVPKFFTCRSVGLGTQGNLGSFCVRK